MRPQIAQMTQIQGLKSDLAFICAICGGLFLNFRSVASV
jgi:hypothetical protein